MTPQAHAEAAARLERLRGFVAADPKNPALVAESAELALQLGLARDAHQWIEVALAATPGDPRLLASFASAKLGMGELQAAVDLLGPLVESNPDSVPLRYNYGYALLRVGQYEQAKEALARIVDRAEAPANTRHLLLSALHYLGELDEAIGHGLKIAELNPGDVMAAGMLSLIYADAGNWAEAKRWSKTVLQDQPDNLEGLLAAGTVALTEEDDEDARAKFDKALERGPANERAWAGRGAAAMLKFNLPEARSNFERAVQAMPQNVQLRNALAWCQMLEKDYAGAKATLESALAIDRTVGDTHGNLAVLAVFEGRREEAEHLAKRARGLDPMSFGATLADTLLLQAAGRPEAARQLFEANFRAAAWPGGGTAADVLLRTARRKHQHGYPRPR